MPIISAHFVRNPRKVRLCAQCDRLIIYGRTLRMYGSAGYGEKPWRIYVHEDCCREGADKAQWREWLARDDGTECGAGC